jgi:hypothetical protein
VTVFRDYRIWRAWRRLIKAWKEAMKMNLPDKPMNASMTMKGNLLLIVTAFLNLLVNFGETGGTSMIDFMHQLGMGETSIAGVRLGLLMLSALGLWMREYGLRRTRGETLVALNALRKEGGSMRICLVAVLLALLSVFLALPVIAGPALNTGFATANSFAILPGTSMGEAHAATTISALGYYERGGVGITAKFGSGLQDWLGPAGGLRVGLTLKDWLQPAIGLHARGQETGGTGLGGVVSLAFFLLPDPESGDSSWKRIDVTATYYGQDRLKGGWEIGIETSILGPVKKLL